MSAPINDDDLLLYQRVAEFLDSLGWRAHGDAQHTNLRDALPQIKAMLTDPAPDGLRDEFAGQAMQACISACAGDSHEGKSYCEHVATVSYEMADAMLKARGGAHG